MRFIVVASVILTVLVTLFLVNDTMAETVIFQDDFEAYAVGSFPSAGGWELVWNGRGTDYQVITDSVSYSPSKSMQLWGQPGWSANIQREFVSTAGVIGYEAYVRADSNTGTGNNVASICFCNLAAWVWGKRFAGVYFEEDGKIYSRPVFSVSPLAVPLNLAYEANRWYKVRVIIDRTTETYDVWIDDVLAAEDIGIWDTDEIEAVMLASGHAGVRACFDDVKVFEGFPLESLTVTSSPITGIPFTVNSVSKITPYTESLPEGYYYALEMPETYNGYVWSRWLEDGDTNRVKTIYLHGTTWTGVYVLAGPLAPPVGGEWVPTDKLQLLGPWIGSILLMSMISTSFIYVKRKKKR